MYSHEVLFDGPFTAIKHFREVKQPSGLVVVRELGHTMAMSSRFPHLTSTHGLRLPDELDILTAEFSRTENPGSSDLFTPGEQIQCENLEDFVRTGIDRWTSLVSRIGSVSKIAVHLEEVSKVIENTTESGLIIPGDNPPDVRFQHYIATPDEIIALERIATSVPLPTEQTTDPPGLYL